MPKIKVRLNARRGVALKNLKKNNKKARAYVEPSTNFITLRLVSKSIFVLRICPTRSLGYARRHQGTRPGYETPRDMSRDLVT